MTLICGEVEKAENQTATHNPIDQRCEMKQYCVNGIALCYPIVVYRKIWLEGHHASYKVLQ